MNRDGQINNLEKISFIHEDRKRGVLSNPYYEDHIYQMCNQLQLPRKDSTIKH